MRRIVYLLGLSGFLILPSCVFAEEETDTPDAIPVSRMDVLSEQQWNKVNTAIDRGLAYLVAKQSRDGSFPSYPTGQPGVSGLVLLAFLSDGHLPAQGRYGDEVTKLVSYIASCQKPSGLFALAMPDRNPAPQHAPSHTAMYNHAVAGTAICEAYGMLSGSSIEDLDKKVELAIEFTLAKQKEPKRLREDKGGWRYYLRVPGEVADSDMSVTGWQLTFLRAANNAGFDVPSRAIDDAVIFIKNRFSPRHQSFLYAARHPQVPWHVTNATGLLALSLAGKHHTKESQEAAEWLLKRSLGRYNNPDIVKYHYTAFFCNMAMFHVGGEHWKTWFPAVASELVAGQRPDGSWEAVGSEKMWGDCFSTSLAILALTTPNQLLPVYQR